jgi:hypothetical protein
MDISTIEPLPQYATKAPIWFKKRTYYSSNMVTDDTVFSIVRGRLYMGADPDERTPLRMTGSLIMVEDSYSGLERDKHLLTFDRGKLRQFADLSSEDYYYLLAQVPQVK